MKKDIFEKAYPNFTDKFETLDKLARLVETKSRVVNISGIKDYDSIWEKHILDALEITKIPKISDLLTLLNHKAIDLGTGAGFPGLVLAIVYPEIQFTLVDSTRKKIEVVESFIENLKLKNVNCIWARGELLSKDNSYIEKYSLVTVRAVGYASDVLPMCIPFIKDDGYIALYKSFSEKEHEDGIKVASRLGFSLHEEHRYLNGSVIWIFSHA